MRKKNISSFPKRTLSFDIAARKKMEAGACPGGTEKYCCWGKSNHTSERDEKSKRGGCGRSQREKGIYGLGCIDCKSLLGVLQMGCSHNMTLEVIGEDTDCDALENELAAFYHITLKEVT